MRKTRNRLVLGALAVAVIAGIPGLVSAAHSFTDVPDGNTFHEDISWLAETGVTRGCNPPENTEFCPGENVTREQMAAFLNRMNTHVLDADAANEPGAVGSQLAAANLATAAYQDVEEAEADGYASTLTTLGCFEDASRGGMGLHYLDESLMDGTPSATRPEALVYELDSDGEIAGLVAHEYIVPVDAWTGSEPPELFGRHFHEHSTLPLWILHAWVWKDNPSGTFEDYNPKVRLCPDGVPVFGEDLLSEKTSRSLRVD